MTGTGTQVDPFKIYDLTDLDNVRNNLTAYYELANDIDASATTTWNSGAGWLPIGTNSTSFRGRIDGKFFKIKNLFINRNTTDFVGLVGYLFNGSLYNLYLENANITGKAHTAGLAGGCDGYATIWKCGVTGTFTGTNYVGAVTSYSWGGAGDGVTISNCYAIASVTATSGTVSAFGRMAMYGTFSNCFSACTLTGSSKYVFPTNDMFEYNTIENCFYDSTLCTSNFGLGVGKTTVQMKTQSTFVNWDFTTLWTMTGNNGYPALIGFTYFTPPNLKTRIDGVVKTYADGKVRIDGALRNIDSIWIRIDGVLKKI